MAGKAGIWKTILELDRFVFTTREIAALAGSSVSAMTQGLARLEKAGILKKVLRGVWALSGDRRFSAFDVVPFLDAGRLCYVSFVSAMHAHGMISQIPQLITVAATSHGRRISTPVGTFLVHQIGPELFRGYDWSRNGRFLIAEPEKALIDSLYIASRRGRRYSAFPEIEFQRGFSKARARGWLEEIKDPALRKSVGFKLEKVLSAKAARR
ncbi:MAG: type IV toxin-antitoxin system AbiEi family antitoxin domain-containing protein [Pseudomonadota bacterium]